MRRRGSGVAGVPGFLGSGGAGASVFQGSGVAGVGVPGLRDGGGVQSLCSISPDSYATMAAWTRLRTPRPVKMALT